MKPFSIFCIISIFLFSCGKAVVGSGDSFGFNSELDGGGSGGVSGGGSSGGGSSISSCDENTYNNNGCMQLVIDQEASSENHSLTYSSPSSHPFGNHMSSFNLLSVSHNTAYQPDFSTIEGDRDCSSDGGSNECSPSASKAYYNFSVNFYTADTTGVSVALQEGDVIDLADLPRNQFLPSMLGPSQLGAAPQIMLISSDNGCDTRIFSMPSDIEEYEGTINVFKYELNGLDQEYDAFIRLEGVKLTEKGSDFVTETGEYVVVNVDLMFDIYEQGQCTQ